MSLFYMKTYVFSCGKMSGKGFPVDNLKVAF